MPIRLVIFLLAILAGFLYLTFFNTAPVPIRLAPGLAVDLPISLLLMASFVLGSVTVMLLYFYDAIADAFRFLRRSSAEKRARRVADLYESGRERLLMENRREAEKFFKKALAHNPDHVPSLVALGAMRREDGEVSEAVKLHSKARGLDGSSISALLELAEDYVAAEQFANAVSVLKESQTLAGKSAPPLIKIRDIFLRVRNLKEAVAVQKRLVAISPQERLAGERKTLTALLYEDGLERLAEKLFYEARDAFKAVLRNDAGFIPAYLKLAEVYERIGAPKDAIRALERGFKATHSLIILKALEMFLRVREENNRIIENYKWAKGLAPDEAFIRLFLAEAYISKADFAAARHEMEAINGGLDRLTVYHLLEGKIRHGENNLDQAMESLEAAYDLEISSFFRFTCGACGALTSEYSGRCRSCCEWNTLKPAIF